VDRETRRDLAIEAACAGGYGDRISWAMHVLEGGADSESPRVLASLTLENLPNPWEVDSLFRRSLNEMGWPPLRRKELLRQRARDLCEDFLSGRLPPRRLTHELYHTAVDLDYPTDLSAWVELDDCWTLIGLYHRDEAELKEEIRQEATRSSPSRRRGFIEAAREAGSPPR
jgi:hypothetical protein